MIPASWHPYVLGFPVMVAHAMRRARPRSRRRGSVPTGRCPSSHYPSGMRHALLREGRIFPVKRDRRRHAWCRCRAFTVVTLTRGVNPHRGTATLDGLTYEIDAGTGWVSCYLRGPGHVDVADGTDDAGPPHWARPRRDAPRWIGTAYDTGELRMATGGRTSQRRRRWDHLRAIVGAWFGRDPVVPSEDGASDR